jgi:hypothetical protein
MAASGVIIETASINSASTEQLWQRWWEEAVIAGHLQWVLMPILDCVPQDPSFRNCIKPSFKTRCDAAQELDFARVMPAGPVALTDGTILVSARFGRTLSFDPYPGNWNSHIESPDDFYISSGTKSAVRKICAALTSGNCALSTIEELAFRIDMYVDIRAANSGVSPSPGTCERILHRTVGRGEFTFGYDPYYSKGRKYLATISNKYTTTSVLVVTNDEIIDPSSDNFIALDLTAHYSGWSSRRPSRSFMVVKISPDGNAGAFHKVGITYPVARSRIRYRTSERHEHYRV